jgi:hypothetical protein
MSHNSVALSVCFVVTLFELMQMQFYVVLGTCCRDVHDDVTKWHRQMLSPQADLSVEAQLVQFLDL